MKAYWRSTFGLAVLISGAMIAATLVTGLLAYDIAHETVEKQLDHRIVAETRELLAEPGPDRLRAMAEAIERRERAAGPNHLHYLLIDARGTKVAGRLELASVPRVGYEEFLHFSRGQVAQALTSRVPGGGQLVVAADRGIVAETDRALFRLIAAGFGTVLVLGLGGAWTLGALTRRRLTWLDAAARAIIGGDFKRRMPINGSGSEFDSLSHTLNRMLDRITALMANLRQISSDVAHDLRAPLTRLRHRLEEAALAPPARKDEAIEAATRQADELLEIFGALLRISEVEAMGVRSQFTRVALADEITELVESYRPDAEAGGHSIETAIDPDLAILGDRRLLLQLAVNLLDNALQHTPAGTHIRVELAASGDTVHLVVADNGPGVPDCDAERLFERFSRADSSRSSPGHGLGLALVAAIAAAHGGSVALRPGPGFAVEVALPHRPAQEPAQLARAPIRVNTSARR